MANKSYASSEIGGEDSRYGTNDPEYSRDFNSAYSKVYCASLPRVVGGKDILGTGQHSPYIS
jgi:hypothetical protein